jgi:hypothetical protein
VIDQQPTDNKNGRRRLGRPGRQLARVEPPQPTQVVAAAGNAIVTAARAYRLLGRSSWRIAKQLPGVTAVEAQAQRIGQAAAHELNRLLELPSSFAGSASPEEQRVMMLVHDAGSDPEPLRTAMTELLDRSVQSDSGQSREYLFGTIVSQLVPDEARILAALATGRAFAAVDVTSKHGSRSSGKVALANASTVGAAAGIALPHNAATYLDRLAGFGLIAFSPNTDHLDSQFEALLSDPAVRNARQAVDAGKQGGARIVRKSVVLSPLGREFWAACAPAKPGLARRSG